MNLRQHFALASDKANIRYYDNCLQPVASVALPLILLSALFASPRSEAAMKSPVGFLDRPQESSQRESNDLTALEAGELLKGIEDSPIAVSQSDAGGLGVGQQLGYQKDTAFVYTPATRCKPRAESLRIPYAELNDSPLSPPQVEKVVRRSRCLRVVIESCPTQFQVAPNYILTYWKERLQCGHTHMRAWLDAPAKRRNCKKCAERGAA